MSRRQYGSGLAPFLLLAAVFLALPACASRAEQRAALEKLDSSLEKMQKELRTAVEVTEQSLLDDRHERITEISTLLDDVIEARKLRGMLALRNQPAQSDIESLQRRTAVLRRRVDEVLPGS